MSFSFFIPIFLRFSFDLDELLKTGNAAFNYELIAHLRVIDERIGTVAFLFHLQTKSKTNVNNSQTNTHTWFFLHGRERMFFFCAQKEKKNKELEEQEIDQSRRLVKHWQQMGWSKQSVLTDKQKRLSIYVKLLFVLLFLIQFNSNTG